MLIEDLKRVLAVDPKRVVIVVGAGVTIGALRGSALESQTSWQGLLMSGVRRCEELFRVEPAEAARLTAELQSGEPERLIAAAEAVARALDGPRGGEYRRWLRETVGAFAPAVRDDGVLEALAGLARSGALLATVNYDGLLRKATGLAPVTWTEHSRVERVLNGEEKGVLHLHGHWETPESVVLGARSYEDVVRDEHARTVLKALRMGRVFVFVGHGAGLADPNWGSFLRWTAAVHAESETRHYRLVREEERARVQAEHPAEQRIFAVPYGRRHSDLAPFLRELAPMSTPWTPPPPVAVAAAEGVDVVLRVVIGEQWYESVSEPEIRRQLAGRTIAKVCEYVRFPVAVAQMEAKDWHTVAVGLDDLVARARAEAERHAGPVRLVVAGVAPLPVFSYLGLKLRSKYEILVINPRRGSSEWDHVALEHTRRRGGRDQFVPKGPVDAHGQAGKVVLSVRCGSDYKYEQTWVQPLVEDEGDALICSYEVARPHSHMADPMVADDIGVLIGHVETATAVLKVKCQRHHGLVLAIGGPSWAAFWVAHRLNPNVHRRIDLPNYRAADSTYVPALAWPMEGAPWVTGRLRIVVLVAEPDDATSIAGLRECEAIRGAIEAVLGPGRAEVKVRGATRVDQIQSILAELRPHVLHLSVHGSEDGEGRLLFEDAAGDGAPLAAQTFIAMLRASASSLVAVVASVCYWGPYAQALTKLAKFVVATDASLPYQAAIAFARSFYGWVARGVALGPAFERAKLDASAAYPAEGADRLRPMYSEDVDPDKLVLTWPRLPR